MDSSIVALRSKALRALGSIVTVDPDVLALVRRLHRCLQYADVQPFVKVALEDRLSDGSPAVRDIAVDLVGKYFVQKPILAKEYYRHIADRIDVSSPTPNGIVCL
jgi:cohesin loading factor subunit SCC2